ncbi:MAG: hypothetical protein SNJ75_07760, partial [Gemmataceae bacterium]
VTGSQRGKSHCYICETADRPMVIIFARTLSEPLGQLVRKLDQAVITHQAAELRGWVTLLAEDESKLNKTIVDWERKRALKQVPIGVFEDVAGPPSYRLHADAEVTVLLAVKQKVVANFAFRAGQLNERCIEEILASLPKILPTDKKPEAGTSK